MDGFVATVKKGNFLFIVFWVAMPTRKFEDWIYIMEKGSAQLFFFLTL
jgi:hypothetical protein